MVAILGLMVVMQKLVVQIIAIASTVYYRSEQCVLFYHRNDIMLL